MRAITQEEFDKLECNQCGDCCERFYLPLPTKLWSGCQWPLDHYNWSEEEKVEARKMAMWVSFGVEPLDEPFTERNRMSCKCNWFRRITPDYGVCTRYEDRPKTCSSFPLHCTIGDEFPRCVYKVFSEEEQTSDDEGEEKFEKDREEAEVTQEPITVEGGAK